MIPQIWGNEGFPIGTSDTASAGELITITPKSKANQSGGSWTDPRIITLLEQIANKKDITEDQLGRVVTQSVLQVIK